jgi:hypothetical protein
MKAVGLAVLMAQAGMFVAADAFHLAPFREVFTRIGSRDDLFRGHSTFVVEMLELRAILRRADRHSLVIGDELCAGTELVSALAIVAAGLDLLSRRGACFVFATHLHELLELPQVAALRLQVLHMSVSTLPGTGLLVYGRKLLPGAGPATYGIEVCRGLDMDAEFLRVAESARREVQGVPAEVVPDRRSRYNAGLVVDRCGSCGAAAEEVHHVVPQARADARGMIRDLGYHKNRRFNLVPLCEACHHAVHAGRLRIGGYVRTTAGVRLAVGGGEDDHRGPVPDREFHSRDHASFGGASSGGASSGGASSLGHTAMEDPRPGDGGGVSLPDDAEGAGGGALGERCPGDRLSNGDPPSPPPSPPPPPPPAPAAPKLRQSRLDRFRCAARRELRLR